MQPATELMPSMSKPLQLTHLRGWCGRPAEPRSGRQHGLGSSRRQASLREMAEQQSLTPWGFGFQCNERLLAWNDDAGLRLTKIYVARELGETVPQVDERCQQLLTLVPDLESKFRKLKATLLLDLLRDVEGLAGRVLALKSALPSLDASRLIARFPPVLTLEPPRLTAQMAELRRLVAPHGVTAEAVVEKEPAVLKVDLPALLQDLKRQLPVRSDPTKLLAHSPNQVISMQDAGLDSSN